MPARDEQLRVSVETRAEDVAVVTVAGELDMHTRPVLEAALADHPPRVILDMRGLTFVDSAGVHVMVALQRRVAAQGGWLRLVYGRQQQLSRVLDILGLTELFPPYDDPEAAVTA